MKVLIVEDEVRVANFLRKGLREAGHDVDAVANGQKACECVANTEYDMILLDWMLPDTSGIDLCLDWRKQALRIPIIMVTAKDTTHDLISALDGGADDYLIKPFALAELFARMRALHRRSSEIPPKATFKLDDLVLDWASREARRSKDQIYLSPREFSLLEFFFRNLGKTISKRELSEQVLGVHHDANTNLIEVHINHLRNKLDCGSKRPLIHTIRGVGYVLKVLEQ